MGYTAPARARTRYWSRGGLALLALACLAAAPPRSTITPPRGRRRRPSGTVTPRAGTAALSLRLNVPYLTLPRLLPSAFRKGGGRGRDSVFGIQVFGTLHFAFILGLPLVAPGQLLMSNYLDAIAQAQSVDIPPEASNNAVNAAVNPVNLASTRSHVPGNLVTAKLSPARRQRQRRRCCLCMLASAERGAGPPNYQHRR